MSVSVAGEPCDRNGDNGDWTGQVEGVKPTYLHSSLYCCRGIPSDYGTLSLWMITWAKIHLEGLGHVLEALTIQRRPTVD